MLQAATITPAKAAGKADDLGSIDVGKIGDLIVLSANPLEDIRNTSRIDAVVIGGRLMRRSDLDALLRLAESLASKN